MLDDIRRYLDATVAIAIMATLGIASGFIASGLTGDRNLAFVAAGVAFALTGAALVLRLWLATRKRAPPLDPARE